MVQEMAELLGKRALARFDHPVSGKQMTVEATPPPDFAALCAQMRPL